MEVCWTTILMVNLSPASEYSGSAVEEKVCYGLQYWLRLIESLNETKVVTI